VLAPFLRKLPGDEYAAFVNQYVSQKRHLKLAQENHSFCWFGKCKSTRAVQGGPKELRRYRAVCRGKGGIGNPRRSDESAVLDRSRKDSEPIADGTFRTADEARGEAMGIEAAKPARSRFGFLVARWPGRFQCNPCRLGLCNDYFIVEQRNTDVRAPDLQVGIEGWRHEESH
jgi:hypothetical protein